MGVISIGRAEGGMANKGERKIKKERVINRDGCTKVCGWAADSHASRELPHPLQGFMT